MEQKLYTRSSNNLMILFLGWSCDDNTLKSFQIEGFDTLYIYDYRQLESLDIEITSRYEKTLLIAWSFGVWAASHIFENLPSPTLSIAVNGTPLPIDSSYGIAPKVFDLTLRRIKSHGIEQFNQRVWADQMEFFVPSKRDFAQQYEELMCLSEASRDGIYASQSSFVWDYAIVGSQDVIFPPQNMLDYWDKKSKFAPIKITAPHYAFGSEGSSVIKRLVKDVFIR